MALTPPDFFGWVVPHTLAAMAWPRQLRNDLKFLQETDIQVVVTLTKRTLNMPLIEEFGFEYHHLPLVDFAAPDLPSIARFVNIINRAKIEGKKTIVHCHAGRGRTGTMIACYLVSLGTPPAQALHEVRRRRPGSIETPEQEAAVHAYAARERGGEE
jgi:atypical dual specificity phosphatase